MASPHGSFIWYELITGDADAAQAFYADVVGWRIDSAGMEGVDYRIVSAPDGAAIGGLMPQPEGMAGGPAWLGYVGVDDVDAAVDAITGAGGAVHLPAMTVPGVGRMAMVADQQGNPFYVMRGEGEGSRAFADASTASPGHAVWNELATLDPRAAIAFYAERFGWRQEGAMPMGALGDYLFLVAGGTAIGAVMGRVPGGRDGWRFYFLVADIDDAVGRVRAAGGTVLQGPNEIPGGSFSLAAEDPQGARFGLVGPRAGR